MRLFLCEKPSQAKDIAKVLGATQRGNGCINGDGVTITWCVGHLLETAPPEAYDESYKKWSLSQLPIVPDKWLLTVKKETQSQFKTVKALLKKTTELIIATDADREGEMIARELIDYCSYRGKVKRLWLSALNESSIRQALSSLKDGNETLPLYHSALSRSRADWLIGMNLSRLFTLLGRHAGYDGVLTVGRVQTPTLTLVVNRDMQIEKFVAKPYWTITAKLANNQTPFIANWIPPEAVTDEQGRCIHQNVADSVFNQILSGPKMAQVLSVTTEAVKETAPLAFDLTTLQVVCSNKFGFEAQETLDIAQALYEKHKATTYPRSDCGYLPESMRSEAAVVLDAIGKTDPSMLPVLAKLDITIQSRIWNDKKLTAHHGIIPTLEPVNLGSMTEKERLMYQLIRSHYLAQFMPQHVYNRTVAQLQCNDALFQATGKQIVEMGWRSLMKDTSEEEVLDTTQSQVLPPLTEGMVCELKHAELETKQTKPPKPYTQGELIKDMKNIAKYVTDPRLKQKLRDTTGIGTEATRAGIIKNLITRGFLISKGKSIRSTGAAFSLMAFVPKTITDPGMTAIWEQALDDIEQGHITIDDFIAKQSQWITQLVQQYAQSSMSIEPTKTPAKETLPCPECGAATVRRNGQYGEFLACSRYPECKGIIKGKSKSKKK
ncbi:DNA topoisomerase III [Zophobihabitans entericus]|uniref:DNA topoisomerase n=1 Tax=Zophobihabitans entericus TaxID=1635327 RepID=A0A6G9IE90_9GAMM|nr:DNA topoisomerase III [Zophobihabitans entericus]QIQ22129.1 DNA topoisomerase III [Zophobihabitans entericus]